MNQPLTFRNRVCGEVKYNDGMFCAIQTFGIEGLEKNLLLETIQVHQEDTGLSCEQFHHKLPVGMWLDICTTIEIAILQPTGTP